MAEPTPQSQYISREQAPVNEADLPKLNFSFTELPWVENTNTENANNFVSAAKAELVFNGPNGKLKIEVVRIRERTKRNSYQKEEYVITIRPDDVDASTNVQAESIRVRVTGHFHYTHPDDNIIFTDITRIRPRKLKDMFFNNDGSRAEQTIEPSSKDLPDDQQLPAGTGLALYAKTLDEILPMIASAGGQSISHLVSVDLGHGDEKISRTKWNNMFVPLLAARNYTKSSSASWTKKYAPKQSA